MEIIESEGRLVDFGSWFVYMKMLIAGIIYHKYPAGEYTFRWPMILANGIRDIPNPSEIGFDEIYGHVIKEEELVNKKLLQCLSGTLAFKAEYQGKDVFVKYACDDSKVPLLIIESAVGIKFMPKHPDIQNYLGATQNGLVSEYFDGISIDYIKTATNTLLLKTRSRP